MYYQQYGIGTILKWGTYIKTIIHVRELMDKTVVYLLKLTVSYYFTRNVFSLKFYLM